MILPELYPFSESIKVILYIIEVLDTNTKILIFGVKIEG